jgi:hypothetical protein
MSAFYHIYVANLSHFAISFGVDCLKKPRNFGLLNLAHFLLIIEDGKKELYGGLK